MEVCCLTHDCATIATPYGYATIDRHSPSRTNKLADYRSYALFSARQAARRAQHTRRASAGSHTRQRLSRIHGELRRSAIERSHPICRLNVQLLVPPPCCSALTYLSDTKEMARGTYSLCVLLPTRSPLASCLRCQDHLTQSFELGTQTRSHSRRIVCNSQHSFRRLFPIAHRRIVRPYNRPAANSVTASPTTCRFFPANATSPTSSSSPSTSP